MKKIFAFLLVATVAGFAQTDSAKAEIIKDRHKMGSNYYAYPTPNAKYTKAPAGYKPFYLSHYGRHGSRFSLLTITTLCITRLQKPIPQAS